MSSAVQLAAARRLRNARAEMDAQRLTAAVLRTQGAAGKKGEQGDTGPMPAHEWSGTKLRFEKPDGKWGDLVDLRGPKGVRGGQGAPGQGGGGSAEARGFDLSALPLASTAAPDEFIVRQGETWARASYVQMTGWLGEAPVLPAVVPCGVITESGAQLLTEAGVPIVIESCAEPVISGSVITESGAQLLTEAGVPIVKE